MTVCRKRWLTEKSTRIKDRRGVPRRPGHKAPQCGAFEGFHTAVGFAALKKIRRGAVVRDLLPQGIPAAFTAVYGLLRDLEEVWNKRTD